MNASAILKILQWGRRSVHGGCASTGDELRVECEVIEARPSKSRPEQGLIKLRTTTPNQDDEAVLVHVVNLVVLRRRTF